MLNLKDLSQKPYLYYYNKNVENIKKNINKKPDNNLISYIETLIKTARLHCMVLC